MFKKPPIPSLSEAVGSTRSVQFVGTTLLSLSKQDRIRHSARLPRLGCSTICSFLQCLEVCQHQWKLAPSSIQHKNVVPHHSSHHQWWHFRSAGTCVRCLRVRSGPALPTQRRWDEDHIRRSDMRRGIRLCAHGSKWGISNRLETEADCLQSAIQRHHGKDCEDILHRAVG